MCFDRAALGKPAILYNLVERLEEQCNLASAEPFRFIPVDGGPLQSPNTSGDGADLALRGNAQTVRTPSRLLASKFPFLMCDYRLIYFQLKDNDRPRVRFEEATSSGHSSSRTARDAHLPVDETSHAHSDSAVPASPDGSVGNAQPSKGKRRRDDDVTTHDSNSEGENVQANQDGIAAL